MLRLSMAALAVALLIAAAAPALANPPDDEVSVIDEVVEIDCGGEPIVRVRSGWVGLPNAHDVELTRFHIAITYTNDDGANWRYQDTGLVRFYERDEDFVSLSGHSTNVGPGNTGWYGHWEFNLSAGSLHKLVGSAQGDVDAVACDALTN